MALILFRPAFWAAILLLALLLAALAWRLRLRWLPAWFTRVALIALILLGIFAPFREVFQRAIPSRQVIVLDASDSIPPEIKERNREQAEAWLSAGFNRMVVLFGSEIRTVFSPGEDWPEIDGRSSDLAGALNLAGSFLQGEAGRLIIATDGGFAAPDEVEKIVIGLISQGHQVKVMPLPARDTGGDSYVGPLWAPNNLWEDTPFAALLPVHLPQGGRVNLQFKVNGETVSESVEQLAAGTHHISFSHQAGAAGIILLEAAAILEGDPRPENNRSYAAAQVFPAPKILFITQGKNSFTNKLEASGVEADVRTPKQLSSNLAALENYQVIILQNVIASDLTPEQMMALRIFVSKRGGGLVVIGGRYAYTLGGYKNTILEPLLPVTLEPPPRKERPPGTIIIAMDTSGSMRGEPMTLAKEAAMRVLETLAPEDYLGVLTYATDPEWGVPIQRSGEGLVLRQAMDLVSQVVPRGGTRIYRAFELLLADIAAAQPPGKPHILLLSDGRSADGTTNMFRLIAKEAFDQGITISTIGMGARIDTEVMTTIAGSANGRYHHVEKPTDLPRIMIMESVAGRSENIQDGDTSLLAGEEGHPVLYGMGVSELPPVSGYIALTSKAQEGAEDVLVSASFGDPVLSTWQYGLGRVVAWMGDGGEEWAGSWLDWDKFSLFWSQIMRYALLNPGLGPAQVDVQPRDDYLTVTLHLQDEAVTGRPLNLASPEFSFVDVENVVRTYDIPQIEPGSYSLQIPSPEQGAYRGVIRYRYGADLKEVPAYFAIDYPAEWRPGEHAGGIASLLDWIESSATGLGDLAVVEEAEGGGLKPDVDAILSRLLLAMVIFWPIEIALRRRWLPWR
jgi:Ca-activated chloride channel homolog